MSTTTKPPGRHMPPCFVINDHVTVTIDHGIPVPVKPERPFDAMALGDSFAVPVACLAQLKSWISVENRKLGGRHFVFRRMGDGTVRCWRTR